MVFSCRHPSSQAHPHGFEGGGYPAKSRVQGRHVLLLVASSPSAETLGDGESGGDGGGGRWVRVVVTVGEEVG